MEKPQRTSIKINTQLDDYPCQCSEMRTPLDPSGNVNPYPYGIMKTTHGLHAPRREQIHLSAQDVAP